MFGQGSEEADMKGERREQDLALPPYELAAC